MFTSLPTRTRALMGLAAVVAVVNVLWLVGQLGMGRFEPGYELMATFDRVGQGLDDFSDVRIRGVRVGEVEQLAHDEDGRAIVTMRIDPGVQVPTSTVAAIEPLSVFGPKFVRLDPGEGEQTGPWLEPGAMITDTVAPQELGDILVEASEVLGAIDPQEAFTLLRTLTDVLDGQGERIGRTLDDTVTLVELLEDTGPEAEQLLADLARLGTTFDDRGDDVVALADEAGEVLPDYTARAEAIGGLLEDASDTAHLLEGLLSRHGDDLGTTIDELDRISVMLAENRTELPAFLDALTGFFGGLGEITALELADGTQAGAVEFVGTESYCLLLFGTPSCQEVAP